MSEPVEPCLRVGSGITGASNGCKAARQLISAAESMACPSGRNPSLGGPLPSPWGYKYRIP